MLPPAHSHSFHLHFIIWLNNSNNYNGLCECIVFRRFEPANDNRQMEIPVGSFGLTLAGISLSLSRMLNGNRG